MTIVRQVCVDISAFAVRSIQHRLVKVPLWIRVSVNDYCMLASLGVGISGARTRTEMLATGKLICK